MDRAVWDKIFERYVVPFHGWNSHFNAPTLIPHKDGEPLLNKNLPSLLDSARLLPTMHVDIYTHGLLLTQKFVDFLATLPNKVRLLITFHFYNHDGSENDYGKASALIKSVLADKPGNVEVILAAHKTSLVSMGRLQEWKDSWGHVANINVSLNPWTGRVKEPGTMKFDHCPYDNFGSLFFGVTGNVIACCMDLEEEIVFGNVMADDPVEVVEKVRAFYYEQKNRNISHDLCNVCFGLPKKLHELTWTK